MWQRFLYKQYSRVYRYELWMRRHFTANGHLLLVLLLAAGIIGVDTQSSTTYQLFVFLLVLLIFALAGSCFNRLKVAVNRQLPRYATAGEKLSYAVTVTNLTKKSYDKLAVIDLLDESLPDAAGLDTFYPVSVYRRIAGVVNYRHWRRFLLFQHGGMIAEKVLPCLHQTPVSTTISFTPLRRGKLNFSATLLAKPDLLGLFRRLIKVPAAQSCLVLPKRYPVRALGLPGKRKYQSGGVTLANSIGDSFEFMSLRDYQQGDPLNSIHWKSFAKHGKLVVKEYQDEYFVRRAFLLDTFVGSSSNEQFEAAVSVAASLVLSERQNEALLDFMFAGLETYCFTSGRGVDHLPHLLEVIASIQVSRPGAFQRLHQSVLSRIAQCSSFICVFLHWDQERRELVKQLIAHEMPVAVFLIHDGTLNKEDLDDRPEHFYLIDHHNLADELAAI